MEFPSVGKSCAQSSCNQLDFLPLHCECGQIFCAEHFPVHTQMCKISKVLKEEELKTIQDIFVCSHPECSERSIIPLVCEKCNQHFCIKHRHITECKNKSPEELTKELEKYSQPVEKFNEAKALIDKQVSQKSREHIYKEEIKILNNNSIFVVLSSFDEGQQLC